MEKIDNTLRENILVKYFYTFAFEIVKVSLCCSTTCNSSVLISTKTNAKTTKVNSINLTQNRLRRKIRILLSLKVCEIRVEQQIKYITSICSSLIFYRSISVNL